MKDINRDVFHVYIQVNIVKVFWDESFSNFVVSKNLKVKLHFHEEMSIPPKLSNKIKV